MLHFRHKYCQRIKPSCYLVAHPHPSLFLYPPWPLFIPIPKTAANFCCKFSKAQSPVDMHCSLGGPSSVACEIVQNTACSTIKIPYVSQIRNMRGLQLFLWLCYDAEHNICALCYSRGFFLSSRLSLSNSVADIWNIVQPRILQWQLVVSALLARLGFSKEYKLLDGNSLHLFSSQWWIIPFHSKKPYKHRLVIFFQLQPCVAFRHTGL